MKNTIIAFCMLTSGAYLAQVEGQESPSNSSFLPRQGQITTVAGAGGKTNNGTQGGFQDINLGQTFGVEIGPDKNLYICEVENHRVWRLDLRARKLDVVAGNGEKGYSGDGGLATAAAVNEPYEIRFDKAGNLFVVEMQNHVVRKIDARTKKITTIAGTGKAGYSGDGGAATKAQLRRPHSIAIHDQTLFIADIGNHRIRTVNLESSKIATLAGNGEKKLPRVVSVSGEQPMVGPRALYVTPGTLWIALREGHSVWKLDLKTAKLSHVAGSGKKGYSGDGGPANAATFNGPKGLVVDKQKRVYVVDTENQVIRSIDTKTNHVTTVAGNGKQGKSKSAIELATKAMMDRPHGICVDERGVLYIGDTNNHRVVAVGAGQN